MTSEAARLAERGAWCECCPPALAQCVQYTLLLHAVLGELRAQWMRCLVSCLHDALEDNFEATPQMTIVRLPRERQYVGVRSYRLPSRYGTYRTEARIVSAAGGSDHR